jgi:hypothetical protein
MNLHSQIEIFQKLGFEVDFKKKFKNPFRGDNTPGCFFNIFNNNLYFVDFANIPTHINYIEAVKLYFGLTTEQAIIKSQYILLKENVFNKPKIEKPKIILDYKLYSVDNIPYNENSLNYWKQFNISKDILNLYEVENVSHVYRNNILQYSAKEHAPIFSYKQNGDLFKIYNPLGFKEQKWRIVKPVIEGINHISEGDFIFVTSSLKDVMCLYSIGYQAICSSTEIGYNSIERIKEELFAKFKNVYIYLNNDEPGKKASKKLTLEIDKRFKYINNPDGMPKDPSDFIKEFGVDALKEVIYKKLKRDYCE